MITYYIHSAGNPNIDNSNTCEDKLILADKHNEQLQCMKSIISIYYFT